MVVLIKHIFRVQYLMINDFQVNSLGFVLLVASNHQFHTKV